MVSESTSAPSSARRVRRSGRPSGMGLAAAKLGFADASAPAKGKTRSRHSVRVASPVRLASSSVPPSPSTSQGTSVATKSSVQLLRSSR